MDVLMVNALDSQSQHGKTWFQTNLNNLVYVCIECNEKEKQMCKKKKQLLASLDT